MLKAETPWRYVSRRTPKPRAMWSGRRLLRSIPRLLLGRRARAAIYLLDDREHANAMETLDGVYEYLSAQPPSAWGGSKVSGPDIFTFDNGSTLYYGGPVELRGGPNRAGPDAEAGS